MNAHAPQIGFDRFIHIDWLHAAIRVRAQMDGIESLNELLDAAGLGAAAKTKTRTVLNRIWLQPRPELEDFANRGIEVYKLNPDVPIAALSWGMAIVTYPFFGKVAELVGRLSALQGDCASAEVHRRMSEFYGEREGTYRMTNMVLQSQACWGAIDRVEKGKRLVRRPQIRVTNGHAIAWLAEAALRYTRKAISVAGLPTMAVIYPIALGDQPLAYLVSNSPNLELRSEGSSNAVVALRETI